MVLRIRVVHSVLELLHTRVPGVQKLGVRLLALPAEPLPVLDVRLVSYSAAADQEANEQAREADDRSSDHPPSLCHEAILPGGTTAGACRDEGVRTAGLKLDQLAYEGRGFAAL